MDPAASRGGDRRPAAFNGSVSTMTDETGSVRSARSARSSGTIKSARSSGTIKSGWSAASVRSGRSTVGSRSVTSDRSGRRREADKSLPTTKAVTALIVLAIACSTLLRFQSWRKRETTSAPLAESSDRARRLIESNDLYERTARGLERRGHDRGTPEFSRLQREMIMRRGKGHQRDDALDELEDETRRRTVASDDVSGSVRRGKPDARELMKGGDAATRPEGLDFESFAERLGESDRAQEEKERILFTAKERWPLCMRRKWTLEECERSVHHEISDANDASDRLVRTIVVGRGNAAIDTGNWVVITMDDNDIAAGRDGDGLIYCDFEWDSSGKEASPYQQRSIPPIIAEEVTSDATEDSVEVLSSTWRPLGSATQDYVIGYAAHPIAGGVRTISSAVGTKEGAAKLRAALSEDQTLADAGPRGLGPFDCSGMTGNNCCLLIKHEVRDADVEGRAIQCFLDYGEGTIKRRAMHNSQISKGLSRFMS